MNPLKALETQGQSPWFDFIRRTLIGAPLAKLVDEDGLKGITSNPAIFEMAIGHNDDYDEHFAELMRRGDLGPMALSEEFAIKDIQLAADQLRPIYDATDRRDGYVSLEVSPYLAHNTHATVSEARRLWRRVDRPNLLVKVPGTVEGVPAIEQLIAEGININVTLLFALEMYVEVAEAYINGLERYARDNDDVGRISSVASFFISRIDSNIDAQIDAMLKAGKGDKAKLESVKGKVAIANAKITYARYKEIYSSPRWKALEAKGAQTQRLLWASTGTKNPAYSDVLYVETLIGRDTVNTMPPATMDAFRDHGKVAATLETDLDGAKKTMADLAAVGISMKAATDQLVVEAVKLFADANDKLLEAVENKRIKFLGAKHNEMTAVLPEALQKDVDSEIETWRKEGRIRRLWAKDAPLWTGHDEGNWLGWLDIVANQLEDVPIYRKLGDQAKNFKDVLLLGMGGSSLGPEVLVETFGDQKGHPKLHVLNSTDPKQIRAFESQVKPEIDDVHRLVEVGRHARAQHPEAVLLRQGAESAGRGRGEALHRRHRPRLEDAGRRRARPLRPHLSGRADHRRALLGAVAVRHGAGRGDGARHRALPQDHPADGAELRPRRAAARQPGRHAGRHHGRGGPPRARQGNDPVRSRP